MIHTKTKKLFPHSIALLFALFICTYSYSQSRIDSIFNKLDPQKFAASITKKVDKLEDKLVAKSMKVLEKMQAQEKKIYTKMLHSKDSLLAKAKLVELDGKYSTLK